MTTTEFTLTAQTASEYDFIIGLDRSGSMGEPSTRFPGKTRWEEAQETILGLSRVLNKYDADGIDVVTFGANVKLFPNVGPDKVAEIFKLEPGGTTPLDGALQIIGEKQATSKKKVVALIFTDGAPNDQTACMKIIVTLANRLERDDQLTFQFVQIGKDPSAARFLKVLDDDLKTAGAKFDIVNTLSAEEAEKMEPLDLIAMAIAD